jgi:cyclophilin family peptidyl-prolyl cis-trans isomerase
MNPTKSLLLSVVALSACALSAHALETPPNQGPVTTNPIPNHVQWIDTTHVIDLTQYFADPDSTSAAKMVTPFGEIVVTLDGQHAPQTVANFLHYINEGRYFGTDPIDTSRTMTFFHRSAASGGVPFVIQGGGFLSNLNPNGSGNVQPHEVAPFPAVPNEPFLSNKRGTIAMAKLGGDPNSATCQFFINMNDNGGTPPNGLDFQNGGFTAFGHVVGGGMSVADMIAALPKFNGGGAFTELPVRDYVNNSPVRRENLVTISEFRPTSPLNYFANSDNEAIATAVVSDGKLLVVGHAVGSTHITVNGFDLDGAGPVTQGFDVTVTAAPDRMRNISTRGIVGTGDNALIGGFIIKGNAPKRVAVRAIGPSLADPPRNLNNVLPNPILELKDASGTTIASNDDWIASLDKPEIASLGLGPERSNEATLLATLPSDPNGAGYTAIVRGVRDETGIGLVEVFDLDSGPGSTLENISTRGYVLTDENVMIGGFIVSGTGTSRVIVRAIGPSLTQFGISDYLPNPTLTFYNSQGVEAGSNDDWQDSPQAGDIQASMLAPTDPRESATIQTLPAGGYTAIVRGTGPVITGLGRVEVFSLPDVP